MLRSSKFKRKKAHAERGIPPARRWIGYIVAVVGTGVALLIRWSFQHVIGDLPLYITFYPFVFAAAAIGGTGPGVLATILSVMLGDLVVLPFGKVVPHAVALGFFIAVNIGVSILGGRLRLKSEALRQKEARLRLACQATGIGIFEWNLQTGIDAWTPEMEALYGLKSGEFGGTESAWEQLVHPEDRPNVIAAVNRALSTFQTQEGEWRVIWPNGSVHWLAARFQAFHNGSDKPLRLLGVNVDVTGRKQRDQALRQSEERLRALVNASSYIIYRMSADWREMRELHGAQFVADTEAPSRTWLDKYIFPEDQPHVLEVIHEAIRTKSVFELEHRVRRADGSAGWTFSRAVPLLDAHNEIVEWFGAASDVTRRKEAEQALQESEERFRTMANAMPQVAWICRDDGYAIWFNRRCYEYTGLTPDQLKGWGWQSIVDPKALPRVLERWRQSIDTGEPFIDMEYPLRGADGNLRPFLARVVPHKDYQGRVGLWFGTATDISELREREEALIRQARLIDLAPAATFVEEHDGTITFWSDGAECLYGWNRADALGKRANNLLRTVFPEPLDNIEAKLKAGYTWSGELRHRTRAGRQVIVQSYWMAELNAQGDIQELLESNTDVTERKRLQEHLEEEVEMRTEEVRETLAELEQMSYSMIHDMRAPLRAMQGFAHILEEDCPDCQHPPGADYLQRIREGSVRLDRLVTDALNYNRVLREDASVTRLDIGKLLRGLIDTYPSLQSHVADINLEFEGLYVLGNESLLTQCVGNILENAVKFVAPGVRPSVRIWSEERYDDSGMVRIWIEDNGIGIQAEAQDKIFRMFQRMHHEDEYGGTGIGLAIVKKCIQRMDGHVGFESEIGKGSKFWIELPKAVEVGDRGRAALATAR